MASYCQLDPDNPRKKRRFPDFCVCYVDQSSLFPDHVSEISKIKSIVESYHRELHIVKLEDVFDEHNATILNRDVATMETGQKIARAYAARLQVSFDKKSLLSDALTKLPSMTTKEDLLRFYTLHLLTSEARKHGCTGLVLGDSSTAIAIRVIANTSKGRGLSLPADIGDSDWHRDVHLLRPMRDILSKEIGIFNHLCKLETVAHTSFATLLPTKTSIDRLSQGRLTILTTLRQSIHWSKLQLYPANQLVEMLQNVAHPLKHSQNAVRVLDQLRANLIYITYCATPVGISHMISPNPSNPTRQCKRRCFQDMSCATLFPATLQREYEGSD
ncbi:hypothetical protein BSLG_006966 [Batrachochytrium salamandrivorans]|nr:hypothetical protein BSLG_006966 [Batrachochytrium salamandrivorans]